MIVGGTRVVVGEGLGTEIGVGAVEQAQSPERTDMTIGHPSHYTHTPRGVAQLASAPRLGRGGRRFESAHPDLQTADSEIIGGFLVKRNSPSAHLDFSKNA